MGSAQVGAEETLGNKVLEFMEEIHLAQVYVALR